MTSPLADFIHVQAGLRPPGRQDQAVWEKTRAVVSRPEKERASSLRTTRRSLDCQGPSINSSVARIKYWRGQGQDLLLPWTAA